MFTTSVAIFKFPRGGGGSDGKRKAVKIHYWDGSIQPPHLHQQQGFDFQSLMISPPSFFFEPILILSSKVLGNGPPSEEDELFFCFLERGITIKFDSDLHGEVREKLLLIMLVWNKLIRPATFRPHLAANEIKVGGGIYIHSFPISFSF